MTPLLQYVRHHRVLLLAGFVCGLIIIYCAWSTLTWTMYGSSSHNVQQRLKQELQSALQLSAKNKEEREAKVRALMGATQAIKEGGEACQVSGFVMWQRHMLTGIDRGIKECDEVMRRMNVLSADISRFLTYLKTEEMLDSIIAKRLKDEGVNQSLAGHVDVWHATSVEIETLSVDNVAQPLKQAMIAYAQGVEKAWGDLKNADELKNRTGYTTAKANLKASYAKVDSVITISLAQFDIQTEQVQKSYDDIK